MEPISQPDYAGVLARFQDASPGALRSMVEQAAAPLGGRDITVYMVDFAGVVLQPLVFGLDEPIVPEEDVASTMAGRVFRTGEPLTTRTGCGSGFRYWNRPTAPVSSPSPFPGPAARSSSSACSSGCSPAC